MTTEQKDSLVELITNVINAPKIQVCDIVEYGLDSYNEKPQTYRVTHHLKRIEDTLDTWQPSVTGSKIIRDLALKLREETRQKRKESGLPYTRRFKLIYCKPEEATHLSLTGIAGTHAPILECKKIRTVNWEPELIEQERKEAVSDFWLKINPSRIDWEWE